MRYQVKEALDRINELTSIHPNSFNILRSKAGEIELECVDKSLTKYYFKYCEGEVFMWDKVDKTWVLSN